jgi:hypothetical protein
VTTMMDRILVVHWHDRHHSSRSLSIDYLS